TQFTGCLCRPAVRKAKLTSTRATSSSRTTDAQVTSPNGRPPSGRAPIRAMRESPFCSALQPPDSVDETDNPSGDGSAKEHHPAGQSAAALSRDPPPAPPKSALECKDASARARPDRKSVA